MKMKKWTVVSVASLLTFLSVAAIKSEDSASAPVYIPASEQRGGDAAKGFDYLVNGDYIKSGLPYGYYRMAFGKDTANYLGRSGKSATITYDFNLVNASNGVEVVTPNCLQCHAQVFDGKLVVGMGNSMIDFSHSEQGGQVLISASAGIMKILSPSQYQASAEMLRSVKKVFPYLQTEVQGVNAADRLAAVLAAHRNPITLEWSDTAILSVPDEVVPTDVPAWWLLKKKNAMFYNGFGRGDFSKFLMLSNLLTVKDTAEAREVSGHFGDVLAFIKSIQPPKYPYAIDGQLAAEGKEIFNVTCRKCHGDYEEGGTYPNLLIPEAIIQTDSMLLKSNYQNPQFMDWFNKSWYATTDHPARLEPFNGYIAPPLDGVWATAPYLHNGSVPTLEALLNSKERPAYWQRDLKHPKYDYLAIGWQYETKPAPGGKKVYNTTLPGYGNYGHTFGDALDAKARKALIEYLKTL
jgi:cytochrome c2